MTVAEYARLVAKIAVLKDVAREYPGKTVLAVGHGITNKAIQAVYFKKEMKDIPRMTNAEVRILEL